MSLSTADLKARDWSLAALLLTVTVWGSAFVGIRAAAESFSAGPLTLGRLLVGAIALSLIARPSYRAMFRIRGRTAWLVALYGVAWFGIYNVALNAAEQDLDAGTTALIVNIGPIIIALLAGVLFGEGFPRPLMIGMGVAFVGVTLIAVSTRGSASVESASTIGVVLCVVAALCYAIGALAQKPTLKVLTAAQSVWLGCVIGVIVTLPFAPQFVSELADAPARDIAWTVYLGVFPTAIGFVTWSYAMKRLTTGQVASATYLAPVIATALSWAILDEVPAPLAFVGGALCLVGVAITRYRKREPKVSELRGSVAP